MVQEIYSAAGGRFTAGGDGVVASGLVTTGTVASSRTFPARLRCLLTKASITCAASLAELLPQLPCSHKTATTMSGLRRGVMPTNQALGSVRWPPPERAS